MKKKQRRAVDLNDPVEARNGKPYRFLWVECGECGGRSKPKQQDRFPDGLVAWGVCDSCQLPLTSCVGTEAFMSTTVAFLEGWASAQGGVLSSVRHYGKSVYRGGLH